MSVDLRTSLRAPLLVLVSLAAVVEVSPDAKSAKLDPAAKLKRGATYVATVTTGVEDPAGNALDQDPATTGDQPKAWSFKVRR